MIAVYILIAILIAFGVYRLFVPAYNDSDHSMKGERDLREDATIVDVESKLVGLKPNYKYRTTVIFSDGFKYISHDTKVTAYPPYYKFELTSEALDRIKGMAKSEHNRLYRQQETKKNPKVYEDEHIEVVYPPKDNAKATTWTCSKCGSVNVMANELCWNCKTRK